MILFYIYLCKFYTTQTMTKTAKELREENDKKLLQDRVFFDKQKLKRDIEKKKKQLSDLEKIEKRLNNK